MSDSSLLHQEMRWKNLGLHFDEPSYFVNAQWRSLHPYALILYRTTVAGYCFVWLLWTGIKEGLVDNQGNLFWVFLTNWVLLVLTTQAVMSAFATFYHHIVRARNKRFAEAIDRDVDFPMSVSTEPITLNAEAGESIEVRVITDVTIFTPRHLRLSWLAYNIAITNSLVLSVLYWLFIYDGNFSDIKLNNNCLITVLLILDVFITKYPIRLLHMFYSILFFLFYVMFNLIYCKTAHVFPTRGHRYIYRVLDWEAPLFPGTGITVIVVLLIPAAHVFWFGLYQLRLNIWRRYGQGGTL